MALVMEWIWPQIPEGTIGLQVEMVRFALAQAVPNESLGQLATRKACHNGQASAVAHG